MKERMRDAKDEVETEQQNKLDISSGTLYLTNRFHFPVCLFIYRSQMMSKCGKNKKVAHKLQVSVSLMFLPHFDVYNWTDT